MVYNGALQFITFQAFMETFFLIFVLVPYFRMICPDFIFGISGCLYRAHPSPSVAIAKLQLYFQKNLGGGASIATFFFIWRVPQRVRKTQVWAQVGVGTGVEVDIFVEVPLYRHFVLEIQGKRSKTPILPYLMAFPALAYYETSIGNPVRNLLKQFSKSENYVIWRYDVIMT